MLGGSKRLLVIGGGDAITDAELEEAWADITSEYCELVKTTRTQTIFTAWKKVKETECKIRTAELAVFILRKQYNKEVAESLFLMGYDLIEPNDDEEAYQKSINRLEVELKNLSVFLGNHIAEYKLLINSDDEVEKVERTIADYDEDLAVLSRFMGGSLLKKSQITVAEYASILNVFIKHNEKLKRDGKGKK